MAGGIKYKDHQVVGLTDAQLRAVIDVDPELVRLGSGVIARQKTETFREAWRNHWRAACWSIFLTSALFMEGYDTAVINSFFGLPGFLNSFGVQVNGVLTIPANYQSGLTNIAYVGQCIGLFINGWCQERYGARKSFIGGMVLMTATIFLAVFAVSLNMLLVAELAMGIPWGMFLLKATSIISGPMGWKIPYILQWVWPVPLALGCFFAPESAWWLSRRGRYEEAERTVTRCARPGFYAEREAAGLVAYMRHADALEKIESANGSWAEMFKGVNRRRTEIMLGVWGVQLWNGNIITGLTVEFLENAGMTVSQAFNVNLVLSAMSIIGVMISWVALGYFGRRTIYLTGIVTIGMCLLPIGVLGFVASTPERLNAQGGLMIAINLLFHFSLGPVCYSIVGELPASRLRSRSIVLGRFFYLVSAICGTQLRARMIAIDGWNWQAKSAIFWLGCNLICLAWSFFRLPETGGFSFAELDILFANKVPTRQFKKFKIKDETAAIGVDLSKKQEVQHVEAVNTEVLTPNEREEVAVVHPVQGKLTSVV